MTPQQVVECRRILKWTYAYGYYSFQPAEERRKGSPPAATKEQQGFFEFNQARLRLHAVHRSLAEAGADLDCLLRDSFQCSGPLRYVRKPALSLTFYSPS